MSEAGQATKILSKFIEAMESDDFGALSAPVYAKSFIRMYAQYLGLEAAPLVNEYVSQHAPKTKNHLSDDVRQKLAQADQTGADPSSADTEPKAGNGKKVFSGAGDAINQLSGSEFSLKRVAITVASIVVLVIVVFSAAQCAGNEEEEPAAAGGAASVEHRAIADGVPDAYLVRPGEIEVEQ